MPTDMKEKAKQRREAVLFRILANPYMRYSDIAKDVGITKERVRQILKERNLFTPRNGAIITRTCPVCSKVMTGMKSQLYKHCSRECAWESRTTRVTLVCDGCGKSFTRKPSMIRSEKHYHSRRCHYNSRGKEKE